MDTFKNITNCQTTESMLQICKSRAVVSVYRDGMDAAFVRQHGSVKLTDVLLTVRQLQKLQQKVSAS